MPEYPDIELYLSCLRSRVVGQSFDEFKVYNPFVLRTVTPPRSDFVGLPVVELRRIGKRVALGFESGTWMVVHLMVSGRFRWGARGAKVATKVTHATWSFPDGCLLLTEASSKKRAGVWLCPDWEAATALDAGGIDVLECTVEEFTEVLHRENRTLKRALTNPRWFSGIGNAYSDEILWAAGLSPLTLTSKLDDAEMQRLFTAVQQTLTSWRDRLLAEFDNGAKFPGPGDVTAFRPDFAVHGKFGQPCPRCGKPVQRIVYAENETNYCAVCQNKGVILADRSLSRLLKNDWPRSFGEE